jgi:hypothetical protein
MTSNDVMYSFHASTAVFGNDGIVVDVAGGFVVVATVLPEPPDVTEHADNVIPAARNTDER